MGQFQPKWDPLLLIAIMREVLAAAEADPPESVTQRAYNEARLKAGHPGSPRADRLVARFGVSWRSLVHRALTEDDQGRAITLAGMTRERAVLTSAEVGSALRTVARRLGTSEFSPTEYEQTRDQINRELARRHLHGQAVKSLPSIHTIRFKMSFPEAMAAAGFSTPVKSRVHGMARVEAITLFIEHCGFFPRMNDTAWFARVHGIQLLFKATDRHAPAGEAARERFVAQGRWCPPVDRTIIRPDEWQEHAREDSPALQAARAAFPRDKREGYTRQELRAAIDRALDLLPPGQKLTEPIYRALHTEHRLIAPGVIHRMGKRYDTSFGRLVREAMAARVAAMREPPPSDKMPSSTASGAQETPQ